SWALTCGCLRGLLRAAAWPEANLPRIRITRRQPPRAHAVEASSTQGLPRLRAGLHHRFRGDEAQGVRTDLFPHGLDHVVLVHVVGQQLVRRRTVDAVEAWPLHRR